MTSSYNLTSAWQRVADPGNRYVIARPGLRRIIQCESEQKPDDYVHGSPCLHADLEPSAEHSERSVVAPSAPLWLRVSDTFGPCPIEVRSLGDAAA